MKGSFKTRHEYSSDILLFLNSPDLQPPWLDNYIYSLSWINYGRLTLSKDCAHVTCWSQREFNVWPSLGLHRCRTVTITMPHSGQWPAVLCSPWRYQQQQQQQQQKQQQQHQYAVRGDYICFPRRRVVDLSRGSQQSAQTIRYPQQLPVPLLRSQTR